MQRDHHTDGGYAGAGKPECSRDPNGTLDGLEDDGIEQLTDKDRGLVDNFT
jgi:hypothetical protein